MYNFAITLAIVLTIATAGCASNAPKAQSTAAQPGALNPTPNPNSNSNAAPTETPKPFTPPAGFKARTIDGRTVYCKKTIVVGSRLPTEICMDRDQLKQYEVTNEMMRQDKDRASGICAAAGSCGGQ